jgi:TPR repeat protein
MKSPAGTLSPQARVLGAGIYLAPGGRARHERSRLGRLRPLGLAVARDLKDMEQMETTMTRLLRAAITALMLVALAGAAVAWPDKEDAARDARVAAIRVEAEQGDATAQVEVGLMYYIGDHVPQDYAETVKWYQLAADQGFYPAQLSLARMYEDGRGVPQDIVRAHIVGQPMRRTRRQDTLCGH